MEESTLLARWLEGELTADEQRELERSPEYPTLLRIRQNFTRLQSPRTDENRVLREVLSHKKIHTRKVFPLYRKNWFQAAAVLLVLLGVAFALLLPKSYAAANAQTYALTLPDQSKVILNAGSEASYSRWNWSRNREVSLNGEAYFKVSKGKTFTVKTQLGTVTVLGTQFNVRVRDNRFEVVCYEGRVWVKFQSQETILSPHEQITVIDGVTQGKLPSSVEKPEWTNKELSFSRERLDGVISELERQYDVKIELNLQSAQLFSGSIPGTDLNAALNMIATAYHLEVVKSGDTIELKPHHD